MARQHLKVYDLEGEAFQGNAEQLEFSDASFDVAYSCGVLQHTPHIQRAVDEIHRVISSRGMAVVVVYYRYSWFNLVSKLGRANVEFEDQDPPIINKYSKGELRKIFSATGPRCSSLTGSVARCTKSCCPQPSDTVTELPDHFILDPNIPSNPFF